MKDYWVYAQAQAKGESGWRFLAHKKIRASNAGVALRRLFDGVYGLKEPRQGERVNIQIVRHKPTKGAS